MYREVKCRERKLRKEPLQIVRFTARKDRNVPWQFLYRPVTFSSKVNVAKMPNTYSGGNSAYSPIRFKWQVRLFCRVQVTDVVACGRAYPCDVTLAMLWRLINCIIYCIIYYFNNVLIPIPIRTFIQSLLLSFFCGTFDFVIIIIINVVFVVVIIIKLSNFSYTLNTDIAFKEMK